VLLYSGTAADNNNGENSVLLFFLSLLLLPWVLLLFKVTPAAVPTSLSRQSLLTPKKGRHVMMIHDLRCLLRLVLAIAIEIERANHLHIRCGCGACCFQCCWR
jgi:hypothetical protein